MARARNIKPGFFLNDELAEIEPLGRLLFIGLWQIADREGRIEDRPKKIKAAVLPYDECNVDKLLHDLHNAQFIIRYQVDGQNYIQIANFSKHQNPHPKEAASIIPAFNEKQLKSNLKATDLQVTKNAESLLLNPESLLPLNETSDKLSSDDDEKKGEIEKPRSPFKTLKQQQRFDTFWKAYPRKKNKGQAENTWIKINPNDELLVLILKSIEQAKKSSDWKKDNGEFIPHPSTWLNAKGWEDEYTPATYKPKSTVPI